MLTCDRTAARHYGDDLGRYWSVSQVCEAVAGKHDFYADGSADRGTDLHDIFALTVGHSAGWCAAPDVPEIYAGYHAAMLEWIEYTKPKPKALEKAVKHGTLPYAGRIDFLGSVGDEEGVLDLKSGVPARWHHVQVRAYQEMIGKVKRWILYVSNEGVFRQVPVPSVPRDWVAFQNGISILRWREAK